MAYAPATLTLDYLKALDPPSFAERDPFELTRFYVTSFEAASGRTLYPGQPEMYVIETMAYAHALMGEAIQAGFLQNRAIWASGAHLDAVGANVSTFRLTAQKASCRVSFALEELRPAAIIVPAGTRVAAGAELVFATTADCIIAAGDLTGEADIEAEEGGTAYNGLLPGQIIDLLDPVAFVADAENITESAGGSDVEADERFRERVCNALERVSKAGPRQG
ncbi:MAG: baseplate J/gp47 family protein, partial [Hyphomicrobiales bacterium]|nr:baseplate J/gp47 family protein [Hyphomicrobiales bacterium]